jgi:hypothetical protein
VSPILDNAKEIWERLSQGPARIPFHAPIPLSRVNGGREDGSPFEADDHYFQIRINEMHLTFGRRWFSDFDPLVFVLTEFTYDKKAESVPFVVGPQLLQKYQQAQAIPKGMVFRNTRVAGVHPYRGGRVSISLVLCSVRRSDHAKDVLDLIETSVGALDFSTALSFYLRTARVVLEGVSRLAGMGQTNPIIGLRNEFDPQAGDLFEPSYFALIDAKAGEVAEDKLWVKDGELLYGDSANDAISFSNYREVDYVLYSVVQSDTRGDVSLLPFYPLFERIKQEATIPENNSWKRAKADLVALYQNLVLSPDLTSPHADALNKGYINKAKKLRKIALETASLGTEESSSTERRLMAAEQILDL